MAQQAKVLAAKPDGLNSTPGTYMVEGKRGLMKAVLWSPHRHHGTRAPTQ